MQNGHPIHVLLIEDNPAERQLIRIRLQDAGEEAVHVQGAASLDEARTVLETAQVDVALLDLNLPECRGMETLEQFRELAPVLPVVVLSGLDDFELGKRLVGNGAQDYLVKGREDGNQIWRAVVNAMERDGLHKRLVIAEAVFTNTDSPIMATDIDGVVQRVNSAYVRAFGGPESEIVGHVAPIFRSDLHDFKFYADIWTRLREEGAWEGEIWSRRGTGEVRPEWLRINAVRGETGSVIGYVTLFSDLTFRKRAEEELVRQATTDSLTGLPNRALFRKLLISTVARCARYRRKCAVLFLDLDGFKPINDTMGHDAGDELLREAARRMRRTVRVSDEVARFGGDEFVVILSELRDEGDAEAVAQKMVEALSQPYALEKGDAYVSASIGIAIFPRTGNTPDALIEAADQAMYKAKRAGKKRYMVDCA
ncbi:MAG: diguanylate cyclase domain-containing protein [Rhodospirillaceae bacterium]